PPRPCRPEPGGRGGAAEVRGDCARVRGEWHQQWFDGRVTMRLRARDGSCHAAAVLQLHGQLSYQLLTCRLLCGSLSPSIYYWLQVLSDPEKRQIYGLDGIEGVEAHEKGGNKPVSPFDMFFGGGGGRRKGPDAQVRAYVQYAITTHAGDNCTLPYPSFHAY